MQVICGSLHYLINVVYSSLGGVHRVNKDENDVDVVDKTQEEESAENRVLVKGKGVNPHIKSCWQFEKFVHALKESSIWKK